MANKDPAFLFYSSDFITGCMGLTMEERGQYITLICLQHQQGHLSEKAIKVAVGNVSQDVLKKFKLDENNLFFNQRVDDEIEKRKLFCESRAKNGQLGGRPKKPSGKPSVKPSRKPKKNLLENENINIILNKFKNIIFKYKGREVKTNGWAEQISLMMDKDHIKPEDILKSLDWYAEHIGQPYIPVILSGESLREKYGQLEEAIKRTEPKTENQFSHWSSW